MNKRNLSLRRPAQACPVRLEILEDRSLPAGLAGSPLLPVPDSVTPLEDLARPATGPALDSVSPSTEPVLGLVSQGTGAVPEPVTQSTAPVLAPASQSTGPVLDPVSLSTAPVLAPGSQAAGSAFELITTTTAGGRSLPENSAAILGLTAGVVTGGGTLTAGVTTPGAAPGPLMEEARVLTASESGTQQGHSLAHLGHDGQALVLDLPSSSGVAGTALPQCSVLGWRGAFSAGGEAGTTDARGDTEKTGSGGGAAGGDGLVAPAAGHAASAEEPAGPGGQEQALPPTAPLSLDDLPGPASGVIDEFFPFDPAAWKQATGQFFANVADLVEDGSSLAPWFTVLVLLGSAYELARRDLRRLQAQQVLDSAQLPDLSGLMPPGEP